VAKQCVDIMDDDDEKNSLIVLEKVLSVTICDFRFMDENSLFALCGEKLRLSESLGGKLINEVYERKKNEENFVYGKFLEAI
jgi:hypothetical protein